MKLLRDNHPEDAVEYPVIFRGGNDYPSFLTDALSSIPVASPVAILNSGSSMETGDDKTNDEATSNAVKCDNGLTAEGTNSVASPVAILNSGSSMETGDDKTNDEATFNTAECDNTEGTKSIHAVSHSKAIEVGAKNTPCQDNKLRYISKYLVQFVPDAKPQTKGTTVQISGARVLTSEKCATIIQECEEKKRKEQEEKERKKLLREKKKQEKEEEQRKKKALVAEKRAQAAEKRAQAAEKRAQAAEKNRVQAEKKAQAAAKKAEKEADKASQQANKPSRKRQTDGNMSTRSKLPRVDEGTVDSEAENVCCVCFQSYQGDLEDSDWVQCACNRWLYEDYITDVVHDVHGRELFCPYCCQ